MDHESSLTPRWIVFGTALVYFSLGSVLTAHFMHLKEGWAESHRAIQREIHHAVPDKAPVLEERFCNASRVRYRVREEAKPTPTDSGFATFLKSTARPYIEQSR
jgi:hypothetical protein